MPGPWGGIAQNGNKSFAKETTAEQLKMTEKMMFHLKSVHHSFLMVITHLGGCGGLTN